MLSSPTTSPVKGSELRANFQQEHTKFDFGTMANWKELFTTADDPNFEFVDLPSPGKYRRLLRSQSLLEL
jgi:hypothetical protein